MALTFGLAEIPSDERVSLSTTPIELRAYQRENAEDAKAFRALNEAWITKYFGLEKHDARYLRTPMDM